ncbi:MAG: T9SS type A sorting domain-containing protein [Ferruginibacter sp.]
MKYIYTKALISTWLAVAMLIPLQPEAQFFGGNDDGTHLSTSSGQPLGRNIFIGGTGDGINFNSSSSQPLGRNIFIGGTNDGNSLSLSGSQPLGRNIFVGGVGDGITIGASTSQPIGRNIYIGGIDDGITTAQSTAQPLGRNIFIGGPNDGWAMAFASQVYLPVTLTDFNGKWLQNDGLLAWSTATENNSSHFDLQRSFDGQRFSTITQIPAGGQSNAVRTYSYTDVGVQQLIPASSAAVYYRLSTVDKDGKTSYSGIVVLKTSAIDNISYAVFPNPAKDFITITMSVVLPLADRPLMVRVADISGKILSTQKLSSSRQTVSVANYPNGTYFLQIMDATKLLYTQKLIIQR